MDTTVFSGIKPTGHLTIGNYLGALRRFVRKQDQLAGTAGTAGTYLFCVVDLHALTVEHDPVRLTELTRACATLYLAAGLDPERCLLFRQSDVAAHTELAYLLECIGYVGELSRMIQFKEKGGRPRTRVSLFTYPALMAADILLYGTTEVPVGDDQKQHIELARTLAQRFNRNYGEVFVVPEMAHADVAARVMDLQDPTRKMSKEAADDAFGTIRLLDSPDLVRRKVLRAVTDTESEVRYDPSARPGISNLLDILGACVDADPASLAERYASYGALKQDVVDAVVELLRPLQKRYSELVADPTVVDGAFTVGAARARDLAEPVLHKVKRAIGL